MKLSQSQFAHWLGIGVKALAAMEAGERPIPGPIRRVIEQLRRAGP
jgi:DNA-binding transcriptional regulator YiaG